jgi:hypothetical protein
MIKRPADIIPPPKSSSPIVDTLNRDVAIALAKRLQQYWHDQPTRLPASGRSRSMNASPRSALTRSVR